MSLASFFQHSEKCLSEVMYLEQKSSTWLIKKLETLLMVSPTYISSGDCSYAIRGGEMEIYNFHVSLIFFFQEKTEIQGDLAFILFLEDYIWLKE